MGKAVKLLSLSIGVSMLLSVVLTGCGGKTDTVTSTTGLASGSAQVSVTDSTINTEPVVLKATFWGSPQEKVAVEGATKKYTEKYPNIKVEAIQIPESDYDAKIAAMVASNDVPDWAYIHGPQGEGFAKQGKFINWFEKMKDDKDIKKKDFIDGIWFTLDQTNAWGISGAVECFGLFYNKDLFKEAGISEPPAAYDKAWTWDQFLEAAKKLTVDKNGKNAADAAFDAKNIKQFGIMFENWSAPIQTFVLNNGSDYVLDDGKTFGYSKPEATKAIQRLADLINVQHVAPSPIQAKAIPGQAAGLQAKMIAMAFGGQWMNLDLGANKVNYGIAALPKMDSNSGTIKLSGAVSIFKDSKYPEETWDFAKFMCGEGVEDLYINGLWMPTMTKYYTNSTAMAKWVGPNASHPEGFKDAMLDMVMNHSKPAMAYTLKNQSKIDALVAGALDQVWMGKKTAEVAMKELEPKVIPEIQGRYDK